MNYVLLADNKFPNNRLKRSFSHKNFVFNYQEDHGSFPESFDYVIYCGDTKQFDEILENIKYKFLILLQPLPKLERSGTTEVENVGLGLENVGRILGRSNHMGFFIYDLFENNSVKYDSPLNKMMRKGKKELTLPSDGTWSIFSSKHLVEILVQVFRNEGLFSHSELLVNNMVNLCYPLSHRLSDLADICSREVTFENAGNWNFYGSGEKLKKIFYLHKKFDLFESVLQNNNGV